MKKRFYRVQTIIGSYSVLVLILGVIFIGAISYYQSYTHLIKENRRELQLTSVRLSTGLANYFIDISAKVQTVALSEQVLSALKTSYRNNLMRSKESILRDILEKNRRWIAERERETKLIKKYKNNVVANYLRAVKEEFPELYGEIFVSDHYGALVGATDTLSTYYHAKKYWWREMQKVGKGGIYFDDRGYDESADTQVVGIVYPIYDGNRFLGVIKANIKVSWLINRINDDWKTTLLPSMASYVVSRENSGSVIYQGGFSLPNIEEVTAQKFHPLKDEYLLNTSTMEFNEKKFSWGGEKKSGDEHHGGNLGKEKWRVTLAIPQEFIKRNLLRITFQHTALASLVIIFIIFLQIYLTNLNVIRKVIYIRDLLVASKMGKGHELVKKVWLPKELFEMFSAIKDLFKNITEKNEVINGLWRDKNIELTAQLRKVLESSLDGVQYFKAIRDESNKIVDFEYVFSNGVACQIIQKEEHEIIGARLLETVPGHLTVIKEYGKTLFELYCEVVETGENRELLFEFKEGDIGEWFLNKTVKLGDDLL